MLPFIGIGHLLLGDSKSLWTLMQKIVNYCNKQSGVASLHLGTYQIYAVTDPDDYLTVANTCLDKSDLGYNFLEQWFGNGLVTANGHGWQVHRKLLNPVFNQQMLNSFEDIFNIHARKLVKRFKSKAGIGFFDPESMLALYLLEHSYQTTFNIKIDENNREIQKYVHTVERLLKLIAERINTVWLHIPLLFNWSSLKKKQDKCIAHLNTITNAIIQKRRSELLENGPLNDDNRNATDKCKSLLDLLLHLASGKDIFTDDILRHHLDTMVAASYDTTLSSLMFTLILIGSHPDVQERVYNELQNVIGDSEENINRQVLSQLVYLEAVLKESMRFYPAVPIIGRSIQQDIKLKNYTLRANSQCILGIHGIYRHPMWGADVDQFRPERWLEPGGIPDHPNAFASFSLGRRNCIGKYYAMSLMKITLVHLLRNYHVTADISKVEIGWHIVIKPESGKEISLELRK